eukprot:3471027-Pleurochrysis_carterae.AAC.1
MRERERERSERAHTRATSARTHAHANTRTRAHAHTRTHTRPHTPMWLRASGRHFGGHRVSSDVFASARSATAEQCVRAQSPPSRFGEVYMIMHDLGVPSARWPWWARRQIALRGGGAAAPEEGDGPVMNAKGRIRSVRFDAWLCMRSKNGYI